jgi:hypothetical protein
MKMEYCIVQSVGKLSQTIDDFKNLWNSHKDFRLTKKRIYLQKDYVNYKLSCKNLDNDIIFHLSLSKDWDDAKLVSTFEKFNRGIREIFTVEQWFWLTILLDDVSEYYGLLAYPLIREVENLMRRFISEFMIKTIGLKRFDTCPEKIKEGIKNDLDRYNALFSLDFIHLKNFLFDEYPELNISQWHDELMKIEKNQDWIKLKPRIQKRSNRDRFFSSKIKVDESKIQNNRDRLYDLRNKVAHNSFLNKENFSEIQKITKFLKDTISSAIEKIDTIPKVNIKQKENLLKHSVHSYKTFFDEELFKSNMKALRTNIFDDTIFKGGLLADWLAFNFSDTFNNFFTNQLGDINSSGIINQDIWANNLCSICGNPVSIFGSLCDQCRDIWQINVID